MPILAKCSKCSRSYTVIGQRARRAMLWICPRCKRGRNLPHGESPENTGSDEYLPSGPVSAKGFDFS